MNVLLICGSFREGSYNNALLEAMLSLAPAGVVVTKAPSLAQLPFFNPDYDDITNPSENVRNFRKALLHADRILIFSPEYAHDIPGVLKNGLDWVVASGELVGKKIGVINASTSYAGGGKAHERLRYLLKLLSADVVEGSCLVVSSVNKKIDENGNIVDGELLRSLRDVFEALVGDGVEKRG